MHEFGHHSEAIDNYAQGVPASGNSVDGTAFTTAQSIREYPYGVHTWDAFAAGLINRSADREVNVSPAAASQSFPTTIKVRVVNGAGVAVTGAKIQLHPVAWYSGAVQPNAVSAGISNSKGYLTLPTNPFDPGAGHGSWDVRYANLLVRATTSEAAGSTWMPLSAVGGSYFSTSTSLYTARVVVR